MSLPIVTWFHDCRRQWQTGGVELFSLLHLLQALDFLNPCFLFNLAARSQSGLLTADDWWISHHGDVHRDEVVKSMDAGQRAALEALQARLIAGLFGCWLFLGREGSGGAFKIICTTPTSTQHCRQYYHPLPRSDVTSIKQKRLNPKSKL